MTDQERPGSGLLLEFYVAVDRQRSANLKTSMAPDLTWGDVSEAIAALIGQISWGSAQAGNPTGPEEIMEYILEQTTHASRRKLWEMAARVNVSGGKD